MPNILVVGATRGLGASLVKTYLSSPSNYVFGTSRGSKTPSNTDSLKYISNIDLASESAGSTLAKAIADDVEKLDVVIISAGYFGLESFDQPDWQKEIQMYTTSSIG